MNYQSEFNFRSELGADKLIFGTDARLELIACYFKINPVLNTELFL